jgi:hypothetical protein
VSSQLSCVLFLARRAARPPRSAGRTLHRYYSPILFLWTKDKSHARSSVQSRCCSKRAFNMLKKWILPALLVGILYLLVHIVQQASIWQHLEVANENDNAMLLVTDVIPSQSGPSGAGSLLRGHGQTNSNIASAANSSTAKTIATTNSSFRPPALFQAEYDRIDSEDRAIRCQRYGFAPLKNGHRRLFFGSMIADDSFQVIRAHAAEAYDVYHVVALVESNMTHMNTPRPMRFVKKRNQSRRRTAVAKWHFWSYHTGDRSVLLRECIRTGRYVSRTDSTRRYFKGVEAGRHDSGGHWNHVGSR